MTAKKAQSAAAVNAAFAVPADVETRIRAAADAAAAAQFDEQALLAKYTAEAVAKRQAALQAQIDAAVAAAVQAPAAQAIPTQGAAPRYSVDDKDIPRDHRGLRKQYFKVKVYKGQSKNDQSYVKLGVNGYGIMVTRGVDAILPVDFIHVLDHALEAVVVQSEGGLICEDTHRFPFEVKGEVSEADYLAFIAKCKVEAKNAPVRVAA